MQPPSWLAAWQADQTPPATADEIAADVARIEAALVPVSAEALLVLADGTLALFPIPDNWEDQAQAWYAALADIPEDLIRLAFERVARNCRFWPRPAEVREQIAGELFERRLAVRRLKAAAATLKRDAEAEERNRRHRAAMKAAPIPHDQAFVPPAMKRLQDLEPTPDEVVVSPEDAAAKVAEWEATLAGRRTA